jgi:hypothetical protein
MPKIKIVSTSGVHPSPPSEATVDFTDFGTVNTLTFKCQYFDGTDSRCATPLTFPTSGVTMAITAGTRTTQSKAITPESTGSNVGLCVLSGPFQVGDTISFNFTPIGTTLCPDTGTIIVPPPINSEY